MRGCAVEMRGEDGMVKARTALGKWDDANNVTFDETLRLCVPPALSPPHTPPAGFLSSCAQGT